MEVPGFVEGRMVACLDNAIVQVDVSDVGISSSIANEDSRIVMVVQFGGPFACLFDADTGAKDLQMTKVGFTSVPSFKRGSTGMTDDTAVVEVYRMKECRGPVFRVQGRAVKQGTHSNGPRLVPTLDAVLRRAIGARGLDLVSMPFLHLCDKLLAFSELATLVASEDTTGRQAEDFEVRGHFLDRGVFRDT